MKTGFLAKKWCKLELPLQVLENGPGLFYIGTANEDGPCSRESVEYWEKRSEAEKALSIGDWIQREEP